MAILVTGGTGYIGSHTCIELINAGYDIVVVDNLVNSSKEALHRVEKIVGKEIKFYVDYDGEATPKILDIKSKLVALLNTKKDLIVVDNVQPHYGEPRALGYAKVYGTVEDLEYIEAKHIIAKNEEDAITTSIHISHNIICTSYRKCKRIYHRQRHQRASALCNHCTDAGRKQRSHKGKYD